MRARDAAFDYARRGWPVFPCHEPVAGGCSCGRADCTSPAKHPRTRRGLHDASCDPAVIADWWHRWPTANVAISTGARSRIVVVDIDPAHGGDASLTELERSHASLPPTTTVITGSGGRHLYFAHPEVHVRNSAGVLGAGLDIRGDGGYVIAPPSRHPTGGTYRWAHPRNPAALPDWLRERLDRPPPAPLPPPGGHPRPGQGRSSSAWARQAVAGELVRVRQSEPGRRNTDLNRAAFALGQLLGGGHLDATEIHDLLVDAGLAVGLHPREVAATVRSGLGAGARHPRHPPPDHRDLDLRAIHLSSPTPAPSRPQAEIPGPPRW